MLCCPPYTHFTHPFGLPSTHLSSMSQSRPVAGCAGGSRGCVVPGGHGAAHPSQRDLRSQRQPKPRSEPRLSVVVAPTVFCDTPTSTHTPLSQSPPPFRRRCSVERIDRSSGGGRKVLHQGQPWRQSSRCGHRLGPGNGRAGGVGRIMLVVSVE